MSGIRPRVAGWAFIVVPWAGFALVDCLPDSPLASPDASTAADGGAPDVASTADVTTGDVLDAGTPSIVGIAAGGAHACAVRSDGTLLCWGRNASGELGVDLTGNSTCAAGGCRPSPVVAPIDSVRSVCTGSAFTCVAKTNGTVWCWGANGSSQLGHLPASDPQCGGNPCNSTPSLVAGVTGAVQVACGTSFVCARTATDVYCWGLNDSSVVGLPVATASTETPQHIALPNADAPVDLSAALGGTSTGGAHACVALASGAAYCWGASASGMLGVPVNSVPACGDAGATCTAAPKQVTTGSGPLTNVVRIKAGLLSTCALRADKSVWCMGSNQWLALGATPFDFNDHLATKVDLGLGLANELETHYLINSTIDSNKNVVVWGRSSSSGAIGNGSLDGPTACAYGQTCTAPLKLAAPTGAKSLADGQNFSLVLTESGELHAWGANGSGQLGHKDGTNGDLACGPCNPTPTKIALP